MLHLYPPTSWAIMFTIVFAIGSWAYDGIRNS